LLIFLLELFAKPDLLDSAVCQTSCILVLIFRFECKENVALDKLKRSRILVGV